MERDYSDYYISDLVRDLRDDSEYLRSRLRLFLTLKKYFGKISAVWNYLAAFIFIGLGVDRLLNKGDHLFPYIIFAVSGVYLVITTVLLVLYRAEQREARQKREVVNRVFKYVKIALKLAIVVITMLSISGLSDTDAFITVFFAMLTVFWIGVSVAIDVAVFFINRTVTMLSNIAKENIKRTKAAFKNTFSGVGKAINGVKNFASDLKGIGTNIGGMFMDMFGKKDRDGSGEQASDENFDCQDDLHDSSSTQ